MTTGCKNGLIWARHHLLPRSAVCVPTLDLGEPDPDILGDCRKTMMILSEGRTLKMSDSWRKSKSSPTNWTWTGTTISSNDYNDRDLNNNDQNDQNHNDFQNDLTYSYQVSRSGLSPHRMATRPSFCDFAKEPSWNLCTVGLWHLTLCCIDCTSACTHGLCDIHNELNLDLQQ